MIFIAALVLGILFGFLLGRFSRKDRGSRQLEQMRREFVANVSHELKTPLTSIRGYAETLKNGALRDSAAAERFVNKIESNAALLQNLVEDLLKLSEIESGRMEIQTQNLPLREIATEVMEQFQRGMESKGIQGLNRIPAELHVHSDPRVIRQILSNLVDNAVKYTSSGVVTLEVEPIGDRCRITVRDTGIGISDADQDRIFERFYRADKSHSSPTRGTGLGLSIVKHLVQAQGGEVGVRSEPGKGSEFWFTIPIVT
ncbi:MAG: hypothetical protein HYT76_02875 [Deltaproteobacteria bacterium]|nr:hypothetical protein [Deltaproteobacteria bacterium]